MLAMSLQILADLSLVNQETEPAVVVMWAEFEEYSSGIELTEDEDISCCKSAITICFSRCIEFRSRARRRMVFRVLRVFQNHGLDVSEAFRR